MEKRAEVQAHGPDGQAKETELSKQEVAPRASQLLKDFRQALTDTPEFTKELLAAYFLRPRIDANMAGETRIHNPIDLPIRFKKGENEYTVTSNNLAAITDALSIRKQGISQSGKKTFEFVELIADHHRKTNEPVEGWISYRSSNKYENDTKDGLPSNTPTVIQRVEDFFTANFGKRPSQPSQAK